MKREFARSNLSMFFILSGIFFIFSCSGSQQADSQGDESTNEGSMDGWIDLFDGESLNGWKRYNASDIGNLWKVEDGMIACYSEGGGEATEDGGSLITVEQFENFEFSVDWKISPGGNSGIIYHIVEAPEYAHAYETGPEYQLVDDTGFSDDLTEIQSTAANYDMHAPSSNKKLNPPGEWNTSRIVYNQGHVEHWLNGAKVLEFEEESANWKSRYEESKWMEYPGWCKYKKGSIGLQDHGSPIWFRNIKVKRL